MTTNVKMALLLALSVGVFGKLAVAQSAAGNDRAPQVQYAVYHPDQSNAALQTVAQHDRDRCDGDHDRNDRGCRWQWKKRHDRNPSATAGNNGYYGNNGNYRNNNGYYGNNGNYRNNNGYYGNNGYYSGRYGNTANNGTVYSGARNGQNGWYDRNGNFHTYNQNGNWR